MTVPARHRIEVHDVVLVPELLLAPRSADGQPLSDQLVSRLSFGIRVAEFHTELAPVPEWDRLVRVAGPASAFRLITVICTFRAQTPAEPGTFVRGKLGLQLRTDGRTHPVARAIHPTEQTRPVSVTPSTVSVGVRAGVISGKVEQQRGAGGDRQEWVVRGYGALQATPEWQFRATRQCPLVGDYRVDALVELGTGEIQVADIRISADLARRSRVRPYRAELRSDESTISLLTTGMTGTSH